jgi:hypothetical protein
MGQNLPVAERIAAEMRRYHRDVSPRWGYGRGWERIERGAEDHRPSTILTLKPYGPAPVWYYRFADHSGLAAFRPVGKSSRPAIPLDRYGLSASAMLCERQACQALLLNRSCARGLTPEKSDDLLALWLEHSRELAHVNDLATDHVARLLESRHRSVREATIRLLALL